MLSLRSVFVVSKSKKLIVSNVVAILVIILIFVMLHTLRLVLNSWINAV